MLDISNNKIKEDISLNDFKSFKLLRKNQIPKVTIRLILIFLALLLLSLFLPWTQNISSKGYVTTRSPQQRPQASRQAAPVPYDRRQ